MDINRLHYFCTVAQVGSLRKASELLNISQPALSKAIKTLEVELEKKLIIPSGRGIAITDQGADLAARAAPLIDKFNELTMPVDSLRTKSNLRIATFEVFSTYFLSEVITRDFSDQSVEVIESVPGPMEQTIANGFADIGISYLPIPHKELDFLKVKSIKMGIFGQKSKFKHTIFEELPFVVPMTPVDGTPSKAKGLDGWPDHLILRNIKHKATMLETALGLCRSGECVGYFPIFLIDLHNKICQKEFQLESLDLPRKLRKTAFDVYMIKRKTDLESSHFKKISRAFRRLD